MLKCLIKVNPVGWAAALPGQDIDFWSAWTAAAPRRSGALWTQRGGRASRRRASEVAAVECEVSGGMRCVWRSDSDTLHNSQLKLITFAAAARLKKWRGKWCSHRRDFTCVTAGRKAEMPKNASDRYCIRKTPLRGFKKHAHACVCAFKTWSFRPPLILLILTRHFYELACRESFSK